MRCCARRLAAVTERAYTEHCGLRVRVALCVDRQPTEFTENPRDAAFRDFCEAWCRTTKNQLKVPRLDLIESKITHKIVPSRETAVKKRETAEGTSAEATGELESLLAGELTLKPTRRRAKHDHQEVKQVKKVNVDGDLRNVDRLAKDWLFLVVKRHQGGWQLPNTDLYHGEGLRQTLQRICHEQLGGDYHPYFLGYAPFLHKVLQYKHTDAPADVRGEKTFYFRARHCPGAALDISAENTGIVDHAWLTIEELREKIDDNRLIQALPLLKDGAD